MDALRHDGLTVETEYKEDTFLRAYVVNLDVRLRVEVAPDSPRLEASQLSRLGVFDHGLSDIAANMVSAYGGRPVEDVIDLYYLSRRFSWSEIFGYADTKRVPIAYDDLKNSVETSLDSKAISQSTKNLNRV